jgi:hypothetical protein
MTQQGRNMQDFFTNKDCIYFGALVGEYYFCMIQRTDIEQIKFVLVLLVAEK